MFLRFKSSTEQQMFENQIRSLKLPQIETNASKQLTDEKLCTRLAAGTVMTFMQVKRSVVFHDRKTEHFKALSKNCQVSAIADHITLTGHNIKWDHFEILATGSSDIHCRIKESLLIKDLKPPLDENVGSEKLFLYQPFVYFPADFDRSVFISFSPLS